MGTPVDTTQLTDQLRWQLVAAPATPMLPDRTVDLGVCDEYFRRLVLAGADGLAVAAHTGRGERLAVDVKIELVRRAAGLGVPVIAGVGGAGYSDAVGWARAAAEAGAVALLVTPNGTEDAAEAVAYHDKLWEAAERPLIAFDLYSRPYSHDVLAQVLDHPGVVAFKPARLFDAVECQAGIAAARARGCLVLSGEDRMLGPSLMWGAEGGLLGLAAAAPQVSAAVVQTFAAATHGASRDAGARFLEVSAIVDELARVTFRPPYDGYVQRMLWIAADEGLVPVEHAVDPDRPADLDDAERPEVLRVARLCREQVRQ